MHFGRVTDDRSLDLQLPALPPRSEAFLNLEHKGSGLVYCGAPIWACKEWIPEIYPEGTKPSEYLRRYAQHYSMIELNSTFYKLPRLEQVHVWRLETGPEFQFLPKVPKDLSHRLTQNWDVKLLSEYHQILEALGEKHGTSFLQLPEWFTLKDFPQLEKFLNQFSTEFRLAIEFRHPSFFSNGSLLDPLVNFLYRKRMSAVITDTPGLRDVLHLSLMAPWVLIRFQGCFPSSKDQRRLREWVDLLADWSMRGLDRMYLAIHQPKNVAIPSTVNYVQRCFFEKGFEKSVLPMRNEFVES